MSGLSTGGGIGFMANACGYAVDRFVALEVVLPSGELVYATETNRYSDLFWEIQGRSGQFDFDVGTAVHASRAQWRPACV